MKMLLLLSFILTTGKINAAVIPAHPPSDTTIRSVKHWSQDEFMQRYGTDDTSRALINYYFDFRRRGKKTMIWSGAATAASITATAIVAANLNDGPGAGEPGALRDAAVAVLGGSVILTFGSIFAGGFITRRMIYSKRNLYKDILRYHSGKGLQKMIRRARRFRMFVQAEKSSR